jgi:hypothetical protein
MGTVKQKYCSKACRRKQQHEAEKKEYVVACPRCGAKRLMRRAPYKGNTRCKSCAAITARETNTPKGSNSHMWKGGRRVDGYGYVKIHSPGHPFADSTNYVREHLFVATAEYGADYVRANGGTVHHINGNKQDNRINNLFVCHQGQNLAFNKQLLDIAFQLVKLGVIEFDPTTAQYRCPLLSDEPGETA